MRQVTLLFTILTALSLLAACGGDATPPAPKGGAETPVEAPTPVAGRDGEGVLELLPGDARDVLEQAERMEILALFPYPGSDEAPATAHAPFHDYPVLGRADVPAADRPALVAALYRALNENNDTVASCFSPRHGLRVEKGDRTVDLVICFECLQIEGHGADPSKETGGLTSESAEPTFDALLTRLGLPKHKDE